MPWALREANKEQRTGWKLGQKTGQILWCVSIKTQQRQLHFFGGFPAGA